MQRILNFNNAFGSLKRRNFCTDLMQFQIILHRDNIFHEAAVRRSHLNSGGFRLPFQFIWLKKPLRVIKTRSNRNARRIATGV